MLTVFAGIVALVLFALEPVPVDITAIGASGSALVLAVAFAAPTAYDARGLPDQPLRPRPRRLPLQRLPPRRDAASVLLAVVTAVDIVVLVGV